jgi:hypothetical protein
MNAIDLTADGNSRINQTKKRRSLFWSLMRLGSFRRSTITWCRSAVFSAASRALDVHDAAITANNRRINAIIAADASRILQRVKLDDLFGTHTSLYDCLVLPSQNLPNGEMGRMSP